VLLARSILYSGVRTDMMTVIIKDGRELVLITSSLGRHIEKQQNKMQVRQRYVYQFGINK
jgi:hypothetical protein